jgi:seryl-tRNA synthetase
VCSGERCAAYAAAHDSLTPLQTEQEWATRLKKSEDNHRRQLAEKDAESKRALEDLNGMLNAKEGEMRAALEAASRSQADSVHRSEGEYASRINKLKQEHQTELAGAQVAASLHNHVGYRVPALAHMSLMAVQRYPVSKYL